MVLCLPGHGFLLWEVGGCFRGGLGGLSHLSIKRGSDYTDCCIGYLVDAVGNGAIGVCQIFERIAAIGSEEKDGKVENVLHNELRFD